MGEVDFDDVFKKGRRLNEEGKALLESASVKKYKNEKGTYYFDKGEPFIRYELDINIFSENNSLYFIKTGENGVLFSFQSPRIKESLFEYLELEEITKYKGELSKLYTRENDGEISESEFKQESDKLYKKYYDMVVPEMATAKDLTDLEESYEREEKEFKEKCEKVADRMVESIPAGAV